MLGRPLRRREDPRLLRGEGRFLDDLRPPGLAHVAFVRSTHAHARIRRVRVPSAAEGLLDAITAADLDGRCRPLPVAAPPDVEVAEAPHPLLAAGVVRYVGEPVVAVVATSRALAEDAAELVEVEYEPLAPIVDPAAATEELVRWRGGGGDVDGAFAAARTVVRTRCAIPRLAGAPMEPRGAMADVDADGRLTLWCSAQDTQRPLAQLAHVLGRAPDELRVVVGDVGGSFGTKGSLVGEMALVAVAALRLGRPVSWVEDRLENLAGGYQGRGVEGTVELALDGDGAILGLWARVRCDLGAYLLPTTAFPPRILGGLLTGPYAIGAADVAVTGVRTNKAPTGPYRGAGRPEAAYLLERAVDDAARRLGVDPVALRDRNLVTDFPHETPLGATYDSGDLRRCLARAVELVAPERGADAERLVGTGVAAYVETAGGMWERAEARVEASGRVVLAAGTCPHGQGHETTFAQLAADRLGVAVEDVTLRWGDSDVVPAGVGSFSSRSVAMGGSAIALALDRVLEHGAEVAAGLLGVVPDALRFDGGGWTAGGRRVALAEAAATAGGLEGAARFASAPVYSSGTTAAVVEIECATGRLRVLRIAAVDDAGRILNPLLAEGQVLGATVQGLGATLSEGLRFAADGTPLTRSLLDAGLPVAADVPPIATAFVESPSPLNPLGAKGIGESGAIGTPAAIANAVADALGGVAVDPPLTGERLWRALEAAR